MSIRQQYIQAPGLQVFERQTGTGDAVVFIHGFPQTGHQWRHQMTALAAEGYACFAPDNRGFGRTDKPGARVSRAMLAADVVGYLDARGIETCTLVGHDWGGIIAFKAAIDHPDRITRLALLDTLCTVWSKRAVHGYWFKAGGLAEEFFASRSQAFIEVLFGGRDGADLGGRPGSPWGVPSGARPRPTWIDDEALAEYVSAFSDPAAQAHAISYYRYGLPFHVVNDDGSFRSMSEAAVGEMWLHPEGLEACPDYVNFMDYGPDDRHKTFPNPVLWLYGSYLGQTVEQGTADIPRGNPFLDQFSRYFPDLRSRAVAAGHFLGEENPEFVNKCLLAFVRGEI